MLAAQEKTDLEALIGHAETKRSACVDAMNWVQREHGWVSDEHLRDLAELLSMSPEELDSVATFYSLIFRRKVGRHVILVCDSISCFICGSNGMLEQLQEQLGIVLGQTTADGLFSLLSVPCLGVCHRAPAMMIDDDLHVNLTGEKIDKALERYREGPDNG
jgi:NADH-quinone oxidoreductase subunit E